MANPVRAVYWLSDGSFPDNIPPSIFTHIIYAFVQPHPTSFNLTITQNDQAKLPKFTRSLRNLNPPVKTLLSIGGANNNTGVFSEMAKTKQSRRTFINSSIQIAREYKFEGVDLNWEYPSNAEDMSNLALLFQQWREALDQEANNSGKTRLLLTSAVYFASEFIFDEFPRRSYPARAIRDYVDWVSPMCFEYHGSWEKITGQHAALKDSNSNVSTEYGIGTWRKAGVPANKLVMGLPLFGKSWTLQDERLNGIGAPATGVGPGQDGVLFYHQIVEMNARTNATVKFDDQTGSCYSYSGNTWIGYEDVESIKVKLQFAQSQGLAGYFFWALSQDKDHTLSRQARTAWN